MLKEQFYKLLDNPGLLSSESLGELHQLIEQYPYFQAAWILYLKNLTLTDSPDFEDILAKGAIRIPDRKRLFNFIHSVDENYSGDFYFDQTGIISESGDKKKKSMSEDHLIDKFLSHDPEPIKIANRIEEDQISDNEIIEKSVSESDDLITETLAMIYFEQKKYDKAIEAFEKLSLKYPEKSVYFANRIEEIENLRRI